MSDGILQFSDPRACMLRLPKTQVLNPAVVLKEGHADLPIFGLTFDVHFKNVCNQLCCF
jgi:hypothetical protein